MVLLAVVVAFIFSPAFTHLISSVLPVLRRVFRILLRQDPSKEEQPTKTAAELQSFLSVHDMGRPATEQVQV